jgi:hypothetical protein
MGLVSCGEVARDMGLENVPDIKLRDGLTGTQDNPAVLDPFKTYNLVMAANECRYFQMKVPQNWYWKIYLTAANRKDNEHATLQAEVGPNDPPWAPLPECVFTKTFQLDREGEQAVLGVGNRLEPRVAIFHLCQSGAPLHITIASQVSTNATLMGPNMDSLNPNGATKE